MTDLVERLQGSVCYASTNKEWPNNLLREAADEIDRLRAGLLVMAESGFVSPFVGEARALLGLPDED